MNLPEPSTTSSPEGYNYILLVPAFSPKDHWWQRLGEGHLAGWHCAQGRISGRSVEA